MAGGTKRSRQDDIDTPITPPSSQEDDTPTPTPTPTATPTPPITRNSSSSIHTRRQATTGTNNDTTTTTSRPPLTRSSATQPPPPRNNGLGRSNSLFNMSTRRSGLTSMSSSSSSSSSTSFAVPSGSGSSRVGMLTRTQSTPSITSPSQLKAIAGGSGGSGPAGKGDPEDGLGGGGPSKRFGKGKENIPPRKDNNENSSSGSGGQEGGSQRKRPRVSSRGSMSGSARSRGRSGSVVSVRSETSGRHSSLAPSSSASSIASWSARLPSPAPSQASSITPSLDSVTSADPLDLIKDEDEFDVDKTPTKARPVTRSTVLPPTPPPSSPSLRDVEIKSTTERVNLMRVYSDKTETDEDVDMSEDKEIKLNPYKQLKAHLRLSSSTSESTSTDQVIIGREEEKKVLRSYLTNRNDVDVGMYISGPPGTGKTALVTALGRELAEEGWKVVGLGCMGLKVTDIWRRLGEELICGKTEKDVKDFIAQADSKVFIILDEVDSLMPPPPSIAPPATSHLLTKLFSLPLLSPTVKLISISNTLDLTLRARLVLPDSAQPLVLPFKAYNAGEMAPIVSSRIAAATATMSNGGQAIKIDPTAITLLTKKVEAQNEEIPTKIPTLTESTYTNISSIHTRRQATTGTNNDTTTTTSRPPLTRSSATQPPPPRNNGLGRSNSLFNMSTRRSGLTSMSSSSSSSSSTSFAVPSGSGSSRVGMLTRTQSTPSITSPSQLKAIAGGSGGSGPAGKGKENIPPRKDNNENSSSGSGGQEGGSQRKRPRVSSRGSMSGSARSRGRSGSVVSVRSETSGRHSSLAPSSSASSIASWSARLPSPAPSQASSITPSLDSVTSADPLDLIKDEDEFDVDKTPTKARPVTRSTVLPPTPPPSSPSLRDVEIKSTTERVNLMRVYSDKTETDEDVDMSEDKEIKLNPYKQLKAHLRLSSSTSESTSTDQVIIGREEEKGTGKTALVTALGRELAEEGWKVVGLGCMGLKVTDIWRRLGEELICGKTEKDVKDFIAQADSKVFIILDEVDSLMPPPPSIAPPATSHLLTKLFSLPLLSPTVKLISISNTLDLTLRARLVLPDSAQPLVLPFKAYNAGEMAPIVSSRIAAATATMSNGGQAIKIDPTAITLLTKKVEAQNGDLRMCLGVLCSAITLAENEWLKKKSNQALADNGEKKEIPMTKIAVTHILKALTSYTQHLKSAAGSTSSSTGSATSKKIRSVQIQGKMVLVSLLVYLTRVKYGLNGCPSIFTSNGQITPPLTPSKSSSNLIGELTVQNLYTTYCHLLSHDHSPFPPSPESDYRDLLSNLETLGLVSIVGGGSGLGSIGLSRSSSGGSGSSTRSKCSSGGGGKIELCVKEEELKDGLGLGSAKMQNKGIAEEEVNKIWEREEGRLKRMREKERARLAGLADGTSEQYI
ncbi:uncharacterized protein L199_007577 [Kwoniella botswanensis]|uniref:uncharacterized protein n=1 Tax=Kwoniella botswanensis TaxID=1268659 RepID=UPI00315D9C48